MIVLISISQYPQGQIIYNYGIVNQIANFLIKNQGKGKRNIELYNFVQV